MACAIRVGFGRSGVERERCGLPSETSGRINRTGVCLCEGKANCMVRHFCWCTHFVENVREQTLLPNHFVFTGYNPPE